MFIAHFTIRLLLTLLLLMLQIMLQADYKYNDLMYAPKNKFSKNLHLILKLVCFDQQLVCFDQQISYNCHT